MKPNFSSQDSDDDDDPADDSDHSGDGDGDGENHPAVDWLVDFGRGWGPLRLGATRDEVEDILTDEGIEFQRVAERRIEIGSPYAELSFDASEPPQLVDLYLESDHLHPGHAVLDEPLPVALRLLGITSAHSRETLWSMVSGECEFDDQTGKPLSDSERLTTATTEDLLKCSFLWLKSMGLGLSVYNAEVNGISLREPGRVPVVGCGPLTDEQFHLIHSPELDQFLEAAWAARNRQTRLMPVVMFCLIAIPVFGWLLFQNRQLILDLLR